MYKHVHCAYHLYGKGNAIEGMPKQFLNCKDETKKYLNTVVSSKVNNI